jgi:hypothetical protein
VTRRRRDEATFARTCRYLARRFGIGIHAVYGLTLSEYAMYLGEEEDEAKEGLPISIF